MVLAKDEVFFVKVRERVMVRVMHCLSLVEKN